MAQGRPFLEEPLPGDKMQVEAIKQGIARIRDELRRTTEPKNRFALEKRLKLYTEKLNEMEPPS